MTRVLTFTLIAVAAFGQTVDTPTTPTFGPIAGVMAFGAFNQLGNPRWTGGAGGIYPLIGKINVYGTTVADIMPKLATDPITGRRFYAVSASLRQGVHYQVLATGKFRLYVGQDIGPEFSGAQPSGINISLSTSSTVTPLIQFNQTFSAILPLRMLYIDKIGWNPVAEFGIVLNLSQLPKAAGVPLIWKVLGKRP